MEPTFYEGQHCNVGEIGDQCQRPPVAMLAVSCAKGHARIGVICLHDLKRAHLVCRICRSPLLPEDDEIAEQPDAL